MEETPLYQQQIAVNINYVQKKTPNILAVNKWHGKLGMVTTDQ